MIAYIVILVVLIIIFFVVGYVKYNDTSPSPPDVSFKDLFINYQNYGQMLDVDTSDYQLIELGLGKNSDGYLSPVNVSLDPADYIDGILQKIPGTTDYTCYYPDQIVARRVRKMCGQSSCYPSFNQGDIHEYYEMDPNAVPCGSAGSNMGVIVVSGFGENSSDAGGCLYWTSSTVGITSCDPTQENQLWSIEKVDSSNTVTDSGNYGSIKPRGATGYLIPSQQGHTGSNLEISTLPGHNWLFTPVQPFTYGTQNNQNEVSIPKQFVWVGPNFDKSSSLETIKTEIKNYFSIYTTGTGDQKTVNMQTFYFPQEDPPLTNQKVSYVDYTVYNYVKQNPKLL